MRVADILTETAEPAPASSLIYRWVDAKGVRAYVKADAMKARWKHFLPKQLTGMPAKAHKGVSFGMDRTRWQAAGDGTVCFVVDRSKLPNKSVAINGQAIYNLSDAVEAFRAFGPSASGERDLQVYLRNAIEDSRDDPDEVFVIGDILPLGTAIVEIVVARPLPKATLEALRAYGEQHGVPVREP